MNRSKGIKYVKILIQIQTNIVNLILGTLNKLILKAPVLLGSLITNIQKLQQDNKKLYMVDMESTQKNK